MALAALSAIAALVLGLLFCLEFSRGLYQVDRAVVTAGHLLLSVLLFAASTYAASWAIQFWIEVFELED